MNLQFLEGELKRYESAIAARKREIADQQESIKSFEAKAEILRQQIEDMKTGQGRLI